MNYDDEIQCSIDLMDVGKNKAAITKLTSLIKKYPDLPRGYFERGMAHLNMENDEMAVPDFRKCLSIDIEYPGAKDWLSRALTGVGSTLAAAEILYDDICNDKRGPWDVSPEKWAECAGKFVDAGLIDRAETTILEYFTKYEMHVVEYMMYQASPYCAYSKILILKSEYKKALQFIEKALASKHSAPIDKFIWVKCLVLVGDTEKAKNEFSKLDKGYARMPYYIELVELLKAKR